MHFDTFLLLIKFGISIKSHGYWYIREAVDIVDDDPRKLRYMYNEVCQEIAEKYNTTKYAVERSMRHAIGKAWEKGSINLELKNAVGHDIAWEQKPSNTEFITILMEILWHMKQENKLNA